MNTRLQHCAPPAHVKTLNKPEQLAADWWRVCPDDDEHRVRQVKGKPVIRLDPLWLELQLIEMDKREANARDPHKRELEKRRRAGLEMALGLRLRSEAECECADDDCRYAINGLPGATCDDGCDFIALDLDHLHTRLLEHLRAKKAALDAGDTEEAEHEHECVDALMSIAGSCGVAWNLGKWWAVINPPT